MEEVQIISVLFRDMREAPEYDKLTRVMVSKPFGHYGKVDEILVETPTDRRPTLTIKTGDMVTVFPDVEIIEYTATCRH